MKYFLGLRTTFNNLVFVGFTVVILIWLSVFLYGMFYYLYIPAVTHSRPVYLEFNTSCQSGMCSFPTANVTLVQKGYNQLLARGQPYKIVLDLEMPESDVNRRLGLGMFMVKISMYSQDGEILKSSFRSAMLQYKSPLLRYLYTFFFSPFLLAGTSWEKQLITVSLFEKYEEDQDKPVHGAFIEIQSRLIEVYSATLRIHAHFSGLRYFMYYWPGLSTTIGVITNFYFLLMIAIFSWFKFLKWRGKVDNDDLTVTQSSSLKDKDVKAPIPLKQSHQGTTSKTKSKSASFDVLSRITGSPEKKAKDSSKLVDPVESKSHLAKSTLHSRVLEVDITQGVPTMSTIVEEDSCDITPMSDDEKTAFEVKDSDLRRRK